MAKDIRKEAEQELQKMVEEGELHSSTTTGQLPESSGVLSESQLDDALKKYETIKKYGDRNLETIVTSGLGTASFSLTDRALIKMGLYTAEELRALREANPGADISGTLLGVLGPALLTGGTTAVAQTGAKAATTAGAKAVAKQALKKTAKTVVAPTTASLKAGQKVEKALIKALGEAPSKSLAKDIVKKSIAKGAGSAVEGAAFGTGQLLREDALGTAEFNAENLMATVGTGALYGGLVGAAFPPIGSALTATKKGIGKGASMFGQWHKKAFDPIRDAEVLSGLTSSQVKKLKSHPAGQQFLKDLPEMWKKVGLEPTDISREARLEKVLKFADNKNLQLENFINDLDDALKTISAPSAGAVRVYANAAQKIHDEFIAPFATKGKAFNPLTRQAKNIVSSFKEMAVQARNRGRVTSRELLELKRDFDKLNQSFYKSMEPAEAAKAGFAAREYLNNVIADIAEEVGGPQMRATLKGLNQDIHYSLNMLEGLEREVDPKFLLSFRDLVWGTIGYQVGNVPGLVISAAGKLLDSDFKRIVSVLSSVEKANKATTSTISKSIKKFRLGAKLPASSVITAALVKSNMAKDEKGKTPKDRRQAFKNVSKNLITLQTDPEEFANRVERSTYAVASAAPNTAAALSDTMIRGVQFLSSKLPVGPIRGSIPGLQREYEPSDMDMAKFERYLQVVEHPLSVLDELQAGTLTRDHVEALEVVYPDLYHRVRNQVIEELDEEGMEMPYARRIQLGILMDLDADPSITGRGIMQLQGKYLGPEQEQAAAPSTQKSKDIKPTMSGAREIKKDERLGSETYNVTERSK